MNRMFAALPALAFLVVAGSSDAVAQETLAGDWDVAVEVMGQTIPLVLHIAEGDEGFEGTYDSPAQGGFDVPIRSITAEHPEFEMELETGGPTAILAGKHDGDKLTGSFKQATATGTFEGTRTAEKAEKKADEGGV